MEIDNDIMNADIFSNTHDSNLIKAIGVGGGGGNAINYMFKQNIEQVSFAVCNTDKMALKLSPVPTKIVLGYDVTHGLGAGDNPEVGRACAEASEAEVREMLSDGTEMVFITAGMGGGTGTGAAPVIAKIAKDLGILTIGIVTIPFLFEGEKKVLKALDGAEELKEHVDALLVINNERLTEIYPDLEFGNAFEKADDTLANAARSISEIISEQCTINVDFQDVKTTLKDSKTAIISTGYGEGERRVSMAIANALNSPLLKKHDINSSKRLLFKLSYNPNMKEPFKMNEMKQLNEFTNNLSPNIGIKWGYSKNENLGERVKMTILASGFSVTLREGDSRDETVIFNGGASEPEHKTSQADAADATQRMTEIYGPDAIKKQTQAKAKVKYVVLRPDQYDDDEVIAKIERSPAYKRDLRLSEELRGHDISAPAAVKAAASPVSRPASSEPSAPEPGSIMF